MQNLEQFENELIAYLSTCNIEAEIYEGCVHVCVFEMLRGLGDRRPLICCWCINPRPHTLSYLRLQRHETL